MLHDDKDPLPSVTGSVKDALRLGCSAVGFTIYPGSAHCNAMYEQLRAIAEEAKERGLAVVVWSYPRGAALSKEGETAIDVVAYAAQIRSARQAGMPVGKRRVTVDEFFQKKVPEFEPPALAGKAIDDEALLTIIRRYTREAGVRNLERELSTLVRKAVKELILSEKKSVKASANNLAEYLGVPKYRYGEVEDKDLIGIVTGLAWTDVGGELLTIEAAIMPGKGRMTVTGNLRDVMKESISAAAAYVRSRAVAFGIEPPWFDKRDIHVHVPDGATPKDGPSAGVAMVTAIVSVMTGIPVRRDLAMTGEITLRGRVWPIAGLKEKLLAALRGGIKTVLIPEENAKDLVEIADSIKSGLEIVPVSRMDEVLARAMTRKPEPIEWDETTTTATAVPEEAPVEEEASTLTAH